MDSTIQILPEPLFLQVCKFLNKSSLRVCRIVCKIWNERISDSPLFHSNNIYLIGKTFDSVQPLQYTTTNWPALRFLGCFKTAQMIQFIPDKIFRSLSTIHVHECVINKKCLNQIFGITTIIDLHLKYCHLENYIFQTTSTATVIPNPTLVLTPVPDSALLEIHCVNIRTLSIAMCDRDITYLCEHLLPHLNSLVSLTIKEMSQYSILQKLKPHQVKTEFYNFPENQANQDRYANHIVSMINNPNPEISEEGTLELQNEFLPFLFGLDNLHPLILMNQIDPDIGIFPLPIIEQNNIIVFPNMDPAADAAGANADVVNGNVNFGNQIQEQHHELEALIQDDFLHPGAIVGNDPNHTVNGLLDEMEQVLDMEIDEEGEGEEELSADVEPVVDDLDQHLNNINDEPNAVAMDIEMVLPAPPEPEPEEEEVQQNGPVDLLPVPFEMEEDSAPDMKVINDAETDWNPTMQKFLQLIRRNSKTLETLRFSFRRSFHAWNIQLFTHLVPALLENQLQLKSFSLNTFNIPMRNVFLPSDNQYNIFPTLFGSRIAENLKAFFASQTRLKKITLGLRQILPTVQLEILHAIPQTVEILTIWPVNTPGAEALLSHFPNLKEIRIPQDSAIIALPQLLLANDPNAEESNAITSLSRRLFERTRELQKLTAFKGEIFSLTAGGVINFARVAMNLTELELKCTIFSDANFQLIIQHLKNLKSLGLKYAHVTDSGITGFSQEVIRMIKYDHDRNYPHFLENLELVRSGHPISDLIHLRELKMDAKHLTDFGIFFGLKDLRLTLLDLNSVNCRHGFTDWGLNILATHQHELEILDLHVGCSVTETGMKNFVSRLKNLDRRASKIRHVSCTNAFNFYKTTQELIFGVNEHEH